MANDITLTPITGTPVAATNDVGGRHYQLVKPAFGADGVATLVTGSTGLPVEVVAGTAAIGSVTITSIVPGTGSTNLGKSIDSVAGGSDVGVVMLAKRVTTTGTVTPANGDWTGLQTDDSGNLRVNVSAGTTPSQVDDSAFTAGSTEVLMSGHVADETATDSVDEGDMGASRMTLDRKQIMAPYAHTAGGWDIHSAISDGTDATNVKASAGQLGWLHVTNINASAAYIKFYNSASAPTNGSGTPVLRFLIPGGSNGFTINLGQGAYFSTGIGYTLVTGITDVNSTNVAASEVLVNIGYK